MNDFVVGLSLAVNIFAFGFVVYLIVGPYL